MSESSCQARHARETHAAAATPRHGLEYAAALRPAPLSVEVPRSPVGASPPRSLVSCAIGTSPASESERSALRGGGGGGTAAEGGEGIGPPLTPVDGGGNGGGGADDGGDGLPPILDAVSPHLQEWEQQVGGGCSGCSGGYSSSISDSNFYFFSMSWPQRYPLRF